MIEVSIQRRDSDKESKDLEDYRSTWLRRRIARYGGKTREICVIIRIEIDAVRLDFKTSACGSGGSSVKEEELNRSEKKLRDLWLELRLDHADWRIEDMNKFIHTLRNNF